MFKWLNCLNELKKFGFYCLRNRPRRPSGSFDLIRIAWKEANVDGRRETGQKSPSNRLRPFWTFTTFGILVGSFKEERLKGILGDEKFVRLHEFLSNETRNDSFKLEAPSDKSERKLLHEFIKANYKQFVSNTANEPSGKQLIEIYHQKYAGAKANSRDVYKSAPNANRPMSEFKYTECVMYKEGIDTIQAINLLAKHLR